MKYDFKCKKCGKSTVIDMPMAEYTSEGHKCPQCDGELERDLSNFNGGFIWKCNGSYAKGDIY